MRTILPASGIWTVADFAEWLGLPPEKVQQKLSDNGVPVLSFSRSYQYRAFRLEDLKKK